MITPYGILSRHGERALFQEIAERAADMDFAPEVLAHAFELLERSALEDDVDRKAFLLLVIGLLMSIRQGSTCLSLDEDGRRWLTTMLTPLLEARDGKPAPFAFTPFEAVAAIEDLIARRPTALMAVRDVGAPLPAAPIVLDHHVYTHRNAVHEEGFVDRLRALMARELPDEPTHLREAFARVAGPLRLKTDEGVVEFTLEPEQRYAVLAAGRFRLTIVSGGPGTGKTTVIVSLLRLLARLGVDPVDMLLAAPTGKAAWRMNESLLSMLGALEQPDEVDRRLAEALEGRPQTLHRLLGYSPTTDRFRHNEFNPLPGRVIVVDEASMIDIGLMDALLRAVSPEGDVRLILLGDADQLPSVDAGAVLRDLVEHHRPFALQSLLDMAVPPLSLSDVDVVDTPPSRLKSVRLRKPHRAGADTGIDDTASAIRRGDASKLLQQATPRELPTAMTFEKVEWWQGQAASNRRNRHPLLPFLRHWYAERLNAPLLTSAVSRTFRFDAEGRAQAGDPVDLQALFSHSAASRLLCATRVFETGAESLNHVLHHLHAEGHGLDGAQRFLPGEPVLMLENDYRHQVFNGDQGIVLYAAVDGAEAAPMAAFPRSRDIWALLPLESVRGRLSHGYAMTVHKSQGSEYAHVAIVLPVEPIPLLTREILYTAVTRARRSVLLVGSEPVIRWAVENPDRRFSGVGHRLAKG